MPDDLKSLLLRCCDCDVALAAQQMRYRVVRGVAQYRCPACDGKLAKAEERERQAEVQRAMVQEGAGGLFRLLSQGKINAVHISELNERLIELLGGLDGFARFYVNQIVAAAATRPGGKNVLDACKQICNVVLASTQHRRSAPDVENLTTEDLERELLEKVAVLRGLKILEESAAAQHLLEGKPQDARESA